MDRILKHQPRSAPKNGEGPRTGPRARIAEVRGSSLALAPQRSEKPVEAPRASGQLHQINARGHRCGQHQAPKGLSSPSQVVEFAQRAVVAQVSLVDSVIGVPAKMPQLLAPMGPPHDAVRIDVNLQAVEEDMVIGA